MEMNVTEFVATDGVALHLYSGLPQGGRAPRAVVQIVHGMGEHAGRYQHVAEALCRADYAVYANDQRGHGITARSAEDLGDLGPDGWNRCVQDLRELNDFLAKRHPGLPRVLLGHSMGALLAQSYLLEHGETLAGAALSGSSGGGARLALRISSWVARFETWRLGPSAVSPLLAMMLFGNFNRQFDSPRTDFDWLSRDPQAVDQYIEDPLCGFVLRVGSLSNFFEGLRLALRPERLARIPTELPIYVFSGEQDPVHAKLRGLRDLLERYERVGLARVSHRFYPGGRHEMFNELNRKEVLGDLIAWLESALAPPTGGSRGIGSASP